VNSDSLSQNRNFGTPRCSRISSKVATTPAAGAIWETFVFAQLRDRERRADRKGSLFFWRHRTREVDFVVDAAGRLELFEAKWSEVPEASGAVNLGFVRSGIGKPRIVSSAIVCAAHQTAIRYRMVIERSLRHSYSDHELPRFLYLRLSMSLPVTVSAKSD